MDVAVLRERFLTAATTYNWSKEIHASIQAAKARNRIPHHCDGGVYDQRVDENIIDTPCIPAGCTPKRDVPAISAGCGSTLSQPIFSQQPHRHTGESNGEAGAPSFELDSGNQASSAHSPSTEAGSDSHTEAAASPAPACADSDFTSHKALTPVPSSSEDGSQNNGFYTPESEAPMLRHFSTLSSSEVSEGQGTASASTGDISNRTEEEDESSTRPSSDGIHGTQSNTPEPLLLATSPVTDSSVFPAFSGFKWGAEVPGRSVAQAPEDDEIADAVRRPGRQPLTASKPQTVRLESDSSDSDVPLSRLRRPGNPSTAALSNIRRLSTAAGAGRRSVGFRIKYIDDEASCSSDDDSEEDRDLSDGNVAGDIGAHGYDLADGFIANSEDDLEDEGSEKGSEIAGSDGSVCQDIEEDSDGELSNVEGDSDSSAASVVVRSTVQAPTREGQVDARGRIFIGEEHGSQSHPLNKKRFRDSITQDLFREYNATVFSNQLPADMEITWAPRLTKTAGQAVMSRSIVHGEVVYKAKILLSVKVLDSTYKLAQTLLHEMCHAAAWLVDHVAKPPHGAEFKKWGTRATKVYPKRQVTVCHTYDIQYKYHYVCKSCGYIVGRHSKSIDTEATRCNFRGCGGIFELRHGDGKAVTSAKPRSKYHEFVQQQRTAIKHTMPWLTPQQVMKEAANRWTQSKTAKAADRDAEDEPDDPVKAIQLDFTEKLRLDDSPDIIEVDP